MSYEPLGSPVLVSKALPISDEVGPTLTSPAYVHLGDPSQDADHLFLTAPPMGRGKFQLPPDWQERLKAYLAERGEVVLLDPLGEPSQPGVYVLREPHPNDPQGDCDRGPQT